MHNYLLREYVTIIKFYIQRSLKIYEKYIKMETKWNIALSNQVLIFKLSSNFIFVHE